MPETQFQIPFNKEDVDIVISSLLEKVERIGAARVGFHCEKVLGYSQFGTPINVISKVEASLIQDTRYKSRPYPKVSGDHEIYKNPDYKAKSWTERHPALDKFRTAAIAAPFSILVGLGVYLLTTQRHSQEQSLQNKRLDALSDSIAKLQSRIVASPATLPEHTISKDTTK
jgi:hypothetical protein